MKDVLKFIAIFAIVFTSFVFGLNNLYWYYPSEVRSKIEIIKHIGEGDEKMLTKAEEAFGS